MNKKIAYFSSLAFGDLVIELNFLELDSSMTLITPTYNEILLNTLGYKGKVEYFQYSSSEIPPLFFNFKSAKYLDIIKSFFSLRSIIKRYSKKYDIIFYESSWKWKLLTLGISNRYIKSINDNIYNSLIDRYDLKLSDNLMSSYRKKNMICSIFPDSRQPDKSIPSSLIEHIYQNLLKYGFEVTVYTDRELPKHVNYKKLVSLKELDEFIKSSNLNITADSMPLHLSYYRKVPVFVFAKKLNSKHFPPIIIDMEAWSNFTNTLKFKKWIENYVLIN